MDTQIQRSSSSSGGGVHVCRKCGWPFPKPHPSSRHRRAHKRVCGKIEGYSKLAYGDEVVSDDDSKGETLTDGSKSTRRGGSEEELFADAVTEFADVREPGNVVVADAGNLYPPSNSNGAQQNLFSSSVDSIPGTGSGAKEGGNSAGESALQCFETANEATLERKSEEVADEEHLGSDGKINGSEKSFRATEDTYEDAGRRLETFTSCNDRFYNMVETDYLLLREQRTEIGETVDSSEALQGPKSAEEPSVEKQVEKAQQNVILTDASARNFLDDVDSLAKSMKGVGPAGEYVECDHKDARIYGALEAEADVTDVAKEELTLTSENFSADDNELPVVLLESKDAIYVENNVLKNLQESEAGNNAISGTDDDVDSKQSIGITEGRDLDQGKQEETVAEVGIQVDSDTAKRADVGSNGEAPLVKEKGLNSGFVDRDMNLVKGNLSESLLIDQVEAERKLEDELPMASLESKDAIPVENNEISGTAGNVDSTQSLATTKEGDLDQGKQEETGGNVDSKQSIGITEGRDLDQGKQEETVAAVGIQVDSDTAKRVDGDMNLMGENLSESALVDQVEAERKVEDELPIASLESKDTIPVENIVQKGLQESEAANNAISGTAGDIDLTQSLAITKERDLDQGKQEGTAAAVGIQVDSDTKKCADAGLNSETYLIEENEGIISGLTDGDVDFMKEEETVSTFDSVKADSSRDGTVSGFSDGDRNLVKREETATASALDVQADTSSQTNSLEGNRGSVSAATETESLPSQAPAKVQTPILPPGPDNDKQEFSKPSSTTSLVKPDEDESGRNQGPAEAQTPQIPQQLASGSPRPKKIEEIGAEKRHMPLKSFLGESSPPRSAPAKETGQEWNSPARYPTNIKREKRKGRSRAWVPFICCSSAWTS